MKKKVCILFLILTVLLCACAAGPDDTAIRQETAVVLDGLIARDYPAVRAGLSERISGSDLLAAFDGLAREMEGLGDYEMSPQQWKVSTQEGKKVTAIRYLVTAGETRFYIDVTKVEGETGISGFHVSPAESAGPAEVSAGAMGWAVMGAGIAAWAFVLWMAVDCLRREMKRKWLWLLLVLLVWMDFTMSLVQGRAGVNFNFGILIGLSKLTAYSGGGRVLSLHLPLGAIAYFFTRAKLTPTAPAAEVPDELDAQ